MKILKSVIPILTKSADIRLNRSSNNFDFIRLFAASLVLIGHSPVVLNNTPFLWDPFEKVFGHSMAPFGVLIFFVISGFLIAMSWDKSKGILDFMTARILRIFPALVVVVILSVFVLGPILTTLSFSNYISSDITHKYLQNMSVFRMYYALPGVFEVNTHSNSINASLWTIPYEFASYIFLATMGLVYALKNRIVALVVFIFLVGIDILFQEDLYKIIIPIVGIDFKTWYPLLLHFLSGTMYYLFRDQIKFNFLGALIITGILFALNDTALLIHVSILLTPYIILTVSFSDRIPFRNIGKFGDYSYGLYLYAFPVQQLIVYSLSTDIPLTFMIILSFLLTIPFAILSWKVVESPSLKMRGKIMGR